MYAMFHIEGGVPWDFPSQPQVPSPIQVTQTHHPSLFPFQLPKNCDSVVTLIGVSLMYMYMYMYTYGFVWLHSVPYLSHESLLEVTKQQSTCIHTLGYWSSVLYDCLLVVCIQTIARHMYKSTSEQNTNMKNCAQNSHCALIGNHFELSSNRVGEQESDRDCRMLSSCIGQGTRTCTLQ